MKTYTISAQDVFSAVKHQWKVFFAIVLAFAVLGGVGGWLFSDRGASKVGGGGAIALPQVDFKTVAHTPVYYNDCLDAIYDGYKKLYCYLAVDSIINQLPESQAEPLRERLTALNKKKLEFQQITLAPLLNTLEGISASYIEKDSSLYVKKNGALYIPEEFLDNIADQYESQLASIELDLLAAEAAAEIIRQMGVPNYYDDENYDGSSAITNSYTNLVIQAADYGDLLKSRAVLEEALRRLRDEPELMRSESRRVEQKLNEAAGELNVLMEEAFLLVKDVGQAADVIISVEVNDKTSFFAPISYKLIVKHTYRAVSMTESFAAIELFCVLVGICAGAFFAVCRESKTKV